MAAGFQGNAVFPGKFFKLLYFWFFGNKRRQGDNQGVIAVTACPCGKSFAVFQHYSQLFFPVRYKTPAWGQGIFLVKTRRLADFVACKACSRFREFFLPGLRPAYAHCGDEAVNAVAKPAGRFTEDFYTLRFRPPRKSVSPGI